MTPHAALVTFDWIEVDRYVEAFERAYLRDGQANPSNFLPDRHSSLYLTVMRELVRADLEFRVLAGADVKLRDYESSFPQLFDDPKSSADLAFEERRLHAQRNAGVAAPGGTESRSRTAPAVSFTWLEEGDPAGEIDAASPMAAALKSMGFSLVEELGRGSFSRVFRARQGELAGRDVVLKIAPDLFEEPWILARLQHENIVPIHSVHRAGPIRAVCMPFVGATTLDRLMRALPRPRLTCSGRDVTAALASLNPTAQPPRPIAESIARWDFERFAVWLGARLADGLSHAHERGILHCDLKPANVLLSDDAVPMLLDFNLSERVQAAPAATLGGTPAYMAPEQLNALLGFPGRVDARSDVFALGLVLYEVLVGKPALPSDSPALASDAAGLLAQRGGKLASIKAVRPRTSPGCAAILDKCLDPDPASRYPSAKALHEDLQRQFDNQPLAHAPNRSLRERAAKWTRRHPRAAAGAAVGLVALVALAVLGALYQARGARLARAAAVADLARVESLAEQAVALMGIIDPDLPLLAEGTAVAARALEPYNAETGSGWEAAAAGPALDPEERDRLSQGLGSIFLMKARGLTLLPARGADRAALLDEALAWNRRAVGLAGRRAVYLQRAKIYALGGRASDEAAARATADASPTVSPLDELLTASQLIAGRAYADAIPLLDAAIAGGQRQPAAWLALGFAHAELGQLARAQACYTASLALQPQSVWPYYLRGQTHFQAREYAEAQSDFDAALRLRPNFLPALVDRALAQAALGHIQPAIDDLDRALALDGAPTRLFFMRGRLHQRLGNADRARGDHAEGLRRTPNDAPSWIARGLAQFQSDPARALADFDAALELDPESRPALQNKASVLSERLGRAADAIGTLDHLVALDPAFAPARAGRAVLHARAGARDLAHRDAVESLRLDTGGQTTYQAACVYSLTSRTIAADRDEALKLLNTALDRGFGHDILSSDPDLDPLRDDPRFTQLVQGARR